MHTNEVYKRYIVKLADKKEYCFYSGPFEDTRSLTVSFIKFKVRTIAEVQDEDWKTAIAQHKSRIPANTELEVHDVYTNFFGKWLEVEYNNSLYHINPSKVEYVGSRDIRGKFNERIY